MTRHQELLRSLPLALSLDQAATLLRLPLEEVLEAVRRRQLALDDGLAVVTAPLLAELGLSVASVQS